MTIILEDDKLSAAAIDHRRRSRQPIATINQGSQTMERRPDVRQLPGAITRP
jgi:hypothetical protein